MLGSRFGAVKREKQSDSRNTGRARSSNRVEAIDRDAADGEYRDACRTGNRAQAFQTEERCVSALRLGRKDRPCDQIVAALRLGKILEAVDRSADQEFARGDAPRVRRQNGIAAKVHSGGSAGNGHIDAIVDHDTRWRAVSQRHGISHERRQIGRVEIALSDLNQIHAIVDRLFDLLQEKVSGAIKRNRASEAPPIGYQAADHCGV